MSLKSMGTGGFKEHGSRCLARPDEQEKEKKGSEGLRSKSIAQPRKQRLVKSQKILI